MKDFIRQCEEHLAKYHGHASSFFMTFMVVAVCGFISPSLLFAAEIESSVANPVPALREYDREKPKIAPMKPVAVDMMSTSSPGKPMNPGVFSTSSQEKLIQYRNARIQKLIASLLALEKSSAELRAELQKIQTSSPSSTKAINMGQVEKQINAILNQFKKTNFNSEFIRLRSELNVEQKKRVNLEKKEIQTRQVELKKLEKNRPLAPSSTFPGNTQGLPAGSPPGNSEALPQGNPLPPPMQ